MYTVAYACDIKCSLTWPCFPYGTE